MQIHTDNSKVNANLLDENNALRVENVNLMDSNMQLITENAKLKERVAYFENCIRQIAMVDLETIFDKTVKADVLFGTKLDLIKK